MKIDYTMELTILFYLKKCNFKLKSNWLHWRLHHGEPWGKIKTKKAPKSYDVQVKQTYFWANQGQPTPYPLQNLIHVSLAESPTKIEENYIFRAFWTKIHHGLIRSRNWACLVLPESLGKIRFTGAKKKFPLPRNCPNSERPKFGFKEF
jgi:hypothetical protein